MFKKVTLATLSSLLLSFSLCASGDDLLSVYELAIANDPELKAAEAAYLAGRESRNTGLAGLLPQVNATGSYSESDTN
ncbi:MAG: TolC family protein, partial [bacterium]